LAVEVTHISQNGIWLLLEDEELLLPYEQFPWFRQVDGSGDEAIPMQGIIRQRHLRVTPGKR